MLKKRKIIIPLNLLLFKLSWITCVLSAVYGYPWLAAIAVLVVLLINLSLIDHFSGILTIVLVSIIGSAFDQIMLFSSNISYQATGWSASMVPIWIISLWSAFATTLNVSLKFLEKSSLIAALVGGISGPLAFISAEQIGAVRLQGTYTIFYLAIGWAILLPIMMQINKQIRRTSIN